MHSLVGGELSFLKLGSVLVGFQWGWAGFILRANTAKLLFLRSTVDLSCRLDLKWWLEVFTYCMCVLTMWSDNGWSLGEGTNFHFS